MKNSIIRIICGLMVSSMLLTLVACKKDPSTENFGESSSEIVTSGVETDKNGLEVDNIGEDIYYDGRQVGVFGWSGGGEADFDTTSGTNLSRAVYTRNATVEDRLGVKLRFNAGTNGGNSVRAEYIATVTTMLSGSSEYDLLAPYSMIPASLAIDGYLVDLGEKTQIELEGKPWWSQDIKENAMINGKVFFMSGPISPKLLYETFTILVNLDMCDAYMLEDPRYLVKENKWTMEKMFEMSRNIGNDVYADGKDNGDTYGMIMFNTLVDGFVASNGMRYLEGHIDQTTNKETLQLDAEFNNGIKTIDLVERITSAAKTKDVWITDYADTFFKGNALFMTGCFEFLRVNKDTINFNYGYLPYPMADEDQQAYYSTAGFPYSMWCIPKASSDSDCAAYVLECLASESYRIVQPVVFDDIKFKYSNDTINTEMFDLIVGSMTFDYGRLFNNNFIFTMAPVWIFRSSVIEGKNFTSSLAGGQEHISTTLSAINKLFE